MGKHKQYIVRKLREFKQTFAILLFQKQSIKQNKIIFINFFGKGYGCNPKYITEELLKRNITADIVWITDEKKTDFPTAIRIVKYFSFQMFFEVMTSKVWVFNIKNAFDIPKKKEQFYIQTWHGAIPLKKIEGDAESVLSSHYLEVSKKDSQKTDVMLANCKFQAEIIHRAFWYEGKVLECGLPRNSILFGNNEHIKKKVYSHFGISLDRTLILYAPTFRKSVDISIYQFNYHKFLNIMDRQFSKKYCLLFRLHPNEQKLGATLCFDEVLYNASPYPDMQELLTTCDTLITDYSSCMFDMALCRKKVFLYTKDIKHYLASERELYFNLGDLPFDIALTSGQLLENVKAFDEYRYQNKLQSLFDEIKLYEDGKGAKVVCDIIAEQIVSEKEKSI